MNFRAGRVLVLLTLCCLSTASHALAGLPAAHTAHVATPVPAGTYRLSDGLGPTLIVCLFRSRGACRPNRVVGTIAAWKGLEQCGILSALSEVRTQPGLCEFFGDQTGTTRGSDTRRRREAGRRRDAGRRDAERRL
jgi:hypothetical protein